MKRLYLTNPFRANLSLFPVADGYPLSSSIVIVDLNGL